MLVKCPECSKEVSQSAATCPHCGLNLAARKRNTVFVVGFMCLIGLGVIVHLLSPDQPKPVSPANASAVSAASPAPVPTATSASPAGTAWHYSEKIDPLDDGKTVEACIESDNEVTQDFPYHNVTATLCLRKSKKQGLNAYVYLNSNGQVLCQVYDGCSVAVRFDKRPPRQFHGVGPADHSTNIVFIEGEAIFLASIKKATTTIVEPRIYQNGDQNVIFNTAGLNWKA
jgi:DNA-directed RNA polymerase subunit RPC12/RpoP